MHSYMITYRLRSKIKRNSFICRQSISHSFIRHWVFVYFFLNFSNKCKSSRTRTYKIFNHFKRLYSFWKWSLFSESDSECFPLRLFCIEKREIWLNRIQCNARNSNCLLSRDALSSLSGNTRKMRRAFEDAFCKVLLVQKSFHHLLHVNAHGYSALNELARKNDWDLIIEWVLIPPFLYYYFSSILD